MDCHAVHSRKRRPRGVHKIVLRQNRPPIKLDLKAAHVMVFELQACRTSEGARATKKRKKKKKKETAAQSKRTDEEPHGTVIDDH